MATQPYQYVDGQELQLLAAIENKRIKGKAGHCTLVGIGITVSAYVNKHSIGKKAYKAFKRAGENDVFIVAGVLLLTEKHGFCLHVASMEKAGAIEGP